VSFQDPKRLTKNLTIKSAPTPKTTKVEWPTICKSSLAVSSRPISIKTIQNNPLLSAFGFVGRRRILLETKVVFSVQVIGMFKQIILQNILNVMTMVDFDTPFYEK
jgi:hypothetical protein